MPAAPSHEPQTMPDAFKLEAFGGSLPAWDEHLLPAGQAAKSVDAYLFSGTLTGWRTPTLLYTFKNSAAQYAYRIPNQSQSIAQAFLVFVANPLAADTVFLGEETYTFVSAITSASPAYSILIGANAFATATNFFAALTFDNGAGTNAGTLYSLGTVANPAADQSGPPTANVLGNGPARVQVFAPSVGAAFNGTVVAESTGNARTSWQYPFGTHTTTLNGGTNVSYDTGITAPSTWMEFLDPDTDVVRSPVVDDQFNRYYFASPSEQPQYNTLARIQAGLPPWLLGVPAPGCTPGVGVTGGGDTATLGFNTTTSVNQGNPGANIVYMIPVTPTGDMILNDVGLMPQATSATAQFAAVLYADNNGTPGDLINVGVSVTGCAAGVQVESAFTNPTGLLMNVQYWIGFMTDTSIPIQLANDTGATGVVCLNTYSNGPPPVINNLTIGYPTLEVWGDCTASSVQEARAYVYTYVSAYDEEGPPSPATIVTGWSNGTWTVDLFQPPPDQLGVKRDLVSINIYRTVTATGGSTTYFFVANVPITQASYTDIIPDSTVVDNLQLVSQLYTPPPEDLQGLITMPNGMIVGWRANELWFCQPYLPHAWPSSYVLTCEYPIVGLGVSGNTVVAATAGAPYMAQGISPATMTANAVNHPAPCVSRGSVLGNSQGVYYASPNGLMLVDQTGNVTNTTEIWITREKWQQLTPQKNLRSVFFVSTYFALGCTRNGDNSVAQEGFTVELNTADANSFTIWPQAGGHRLGFSQLTSPNALDVLNVRIDPWSGVCLVTYAGNIYQYDFTQANPVMQAYDWTSKLYQMKSKKNLAAFRAWFTVPVNTPAQNALPNTAPPSDPSWNTLQEGQYAIIKVYAGGVLVTCRELRYPQQLFRIESGFKAETWQFEILGRVPISNIQVGTSVKAMAKI